MEAVLTWMVFAGGVQYARRMVRKDDPGHYTYVWDNVWRLQRYLGTPPLGLIRGV